ncbi:hypothetical protein BC629DRAFT_1300177, partial [Irpex lacteus]
DVMLFFSQGTPNLAKVIPAMDTIDEKLTTGIVNSLLDPSICIALSLGKKTLERYYSKTNETEAYRICIMLHSQYKRKYFETAKWQPAWIKTVKDIVRTQWKEKYTDRLRVQGDVSDDVAARNDNRDKVCKLLS